MATKRELKKQARTLWAAGKAVIETALVSLVASEDRAELEQSEHQVTIGMVLTDLRWNVAPIIGKKWTDEAKSVLPGRSLNTIRRWENAGAVAEVLGPEMIVRQYVGSLVPFYSGVPSQGAEDEEREAAEALLRSTWQELLDEAGKDENGTLLPVKKDRAEKVAEKLFPSNRKASKPRAKNEDDEENDDEDENEENDEDETTDDENDSRRESSENLVVIEPLAIEAAAAPVDSFIRETARSFKVSRETVVGIMLGTLRLSGEHRPSAIVGAIYGGGVNAVKDVSLPAREDETTDETTPDETTAPPTEEQSAQ